MSQVSNTPHDRHRFSPHLVGREREQAMLRGALEAMLAGHGSLVLVSGEAGIGKTTLVEDLARDAEADGCLVLKGGCYDLSVTPPYGPWIELVQARASSANELGMPSVLRDRSELDDVGSQETLFSLLAEFLIGLASDNPVILMLEDLHWVDPGSIDFLRFFARQLAGHRLLVLATHRSDDLGRQHPLSLALPSIVRETNAERIQIRPLTDEDYRALIRGRYAMSTADEARLEAFLLARSEGNPLFAGELLRTLEDTQMLCPAGELWRLDALSDVTVPPLLSQLIEGRLARMTEQTRSLLEVAAIIGQHVPLSLWQHVTQSSDESMIEAIEEGVAAQLIDEAADGASYRFRHALFHQALHDEVIALKRRDWHRRIAETLLNLPHPDPDQIAHHFRQANDNRAIDWLIHSGERAASLYASKTAIERLEAVLPALEESGDDRRRGWVLWMLGEHLGIIDPERASACFDEAERLGTTIDDRLLVAYARMYRGFRVAWNSEGHRSGLADLSSGVDLLDQIRTHPLEPPPIHTPSWSNPNAYHALRAMVRAIVGDLSGALDDIPEYVSGATDQGGDQRFDSRSKVTIAITEQVSFAYNALGRVRAMQGRTAEAARAFEMCADLMARTNDNVKHAILCMNWLAYLVLPYAADDLELRRTLLERHDRAWERAAEKFGAGSMPNGVSHLLTSYLDGDWSEMDWMVQWWGQRMSPANTASWGTVEEVVFGRRAYARGKFERAWQEVRRFLPDGPATEPGDCIFRGAEELQRLAIELELDVGNLAEARRWSEAHDRWLDWSGAFTGKADGQLLWAQYHSLSGDHGRARHVAVQALKLASDPRQPLALIAIHRFLGQLDREGGRLDGARQHLDESLALADACAAPFERALTLLEMAQVEFALRQLDQARTALAEVREIAERLDARPTLERVAALEQLLSRATPSYPAGLTVREVDVLKLVAQGMSDAEVADELRISPRTVSTHLTSIYTKLQVNSRTAAAIAARDLNLV